MPGVDLKTEFTGEFGSFNKRLENVAMIWKSVCVGSCIELNTISPQLRGALDLFIIRIHKQTDPDIRSLKFIDNDPQSVGITRQIPSMVRSKLRRTIRHQCCLVRINLLNQFDETRIAVFLPTSVWIAFDIEFNITIFFPGEQISQRQHIIRTNVTHIGSGVNGNTLGASGNGSFCRIDNTGDRGIS